MNRPTATPAPAAAAGAGLLGSYHCISDSMTYQVLQAPKSQGGGLLLRRRYPHEPDWRAACETSESHITRLLAFGSFTRIEP